MAAAGGTNAGAASRVAATRSAGGRQPTAAADASDGLEPAPFAEFGFDEEAQELDELRGMLGDKQAAQNRHSPMSVAKYNQWTLVEANRQLGIKMRAEEREFQIRREQSTAAYHAARKAKTSVGRGQMELTRGAVGDYRGQLALRGAEGKQQLLAIRAKAMRQKAEWAAHGARSAQVHGLEQKKRVLESRAERFQARRNAALATKQETEARKAAARELMARALEEKKLRLERTRDGLPTPETIAEAREFYMKQKRESAQEVRKNEKEWMDIRKRDATLALERATSNKADAVNTRNAAKSNRAACVETRAVVAKEMKAKLQSMEEERKNVIADTVASSKTNHQEAYDKKFVKADAAAQVDNSEYGLLLQKTRAPEHGRPRLHHVVRKDAAARDSLADANLLLDREEDLSEELPPPRQAWAEVEPTSPSQAAGT